MTHPPRTFERTDIHGVPRTERERLLDDIEEYLIATAGEGQATKITVVVAVEAKGAE